MSCSTYLEDASNLHLWSRALVSARLDAAGISAPNVVITGQDVTHGKPHPEGYLTVLPSVSVSIRATASSSKMRFPAFARRERSIYPLGIRHQDLGEDQPQPHHLICNGALDASWTTHRGPGTVAVTSLQGLFYEVGNRVQFFHLDDKAAT